MQAVVFHGIGDIRLDNVPEPEIEQQTDAVVRITTAAICGTDLHFVRARGAIDAVGVDAESEPAERALAAWRSAGTGPLVGGRDARQRRER